MNGHCAYSVALGNSHLTWGYGGVTMIRLFWFCLLSVAVAFGAIGQACTTFVLRDGDSMVFGKNYDWTVDDGLVIANRRDWQIGVD